MVDSKVTFWYDTHYAEGIRVAFKKENWIMAALLFLPENFEKTKVYPAIVVTH